MSARSNIFRLLLNHAMAHAEKVAPLLSIFYTICQHGHVLLARLKNWTKKDEFRIGVGEKYRLIGALKLWHHRTFYVHVT